MKLIDTHSHLYDEKFANDMDLVLQRIKDNHIEKIFLPNVDSSTIENMHRLVEKNPALFFPLMGVHPTSIKENYIEELDIAYNWLLKKKYYGIGEIGIDLYWDKTYLQEQINAFEIQIEWAIEKNLPIIIHARESFEIIFKCLKKFPSNKLFGIFHSFTGNAETAETIFSLGNFKIGINGIITFKNSELNNIINQIPLEKIVLETDAPYLAPVPHRGKRNESSYLIFIAEKIAEIKKMSLEEVARKTTESTSEIFFMKKI
jgi:TatD DNase family protein